MIYFYTCVMCIELYQLYMYRYSLDCIQILLYFNCRSDSIQTVDYDGDNFHLVLADNQFLRHPFAITVFENWVYWSDWRTNSINRVCQQAEL